MDMVIHTLLHWMANSIHLMDWEFILYLMHLMVNLLFKYKLSKRLIKMEEILKLV